MATCTLCGDDCSRPAPIPPTVFDGTRFDYLACGACGTTFVHPRPGPETLLRMYPTTYQGEDAPSLDSDAAAAEVELLARHLPPPARVLDFGCGQGTFVARARARGFAADGVEYNADYVSVLRRNHPDAAFFHVDALDGLSSGTFDAVVLSNVLEHLTDPRATLRRLLRLLRPGGIAYCYGPIEKNPSLVNACVALNYRAKLALRPGATSSHPPTHLTFTTRSSQRAFFSGLGLRELHFSVVDNVWPYPRRWRDATGPVGKAKWCIGAASRGVSRLVPGLGNAFFYLGETPRVRSSAGA